MSNTTPKLTWAEISRATGLTIVFGLFVLFAIGFFTGIALDTTITLAFLTVATGLIGGPSGLQRWQLVKRTNGDDSSK